MSYGGSPNTTDSQEVYQYTYLSSQNYGNHYLSDGSSILHNEESNFWTSSPRCDSPGSQNPMVGPYQIYTPAAAYTQNAHLHRQQNPNDFEYAAGRNLNPHLHHHQPVVRIIKRRATANKKERKRTSSINKSYADLRDCIPNVPADTKLSKIKTLRLATSYISYLTGVLETDEPAGGFKAELGSNSRKSSGSGHNLAHTNMDNVAAMRQASPESDLSDEAVVGNSRRAKGRTGWPQHVWALELKQDQAL